jgi:predicted 3-demethylubiquinone-9 3-methyltransferase (glyoxalase superfamily)
MQKITPFLFFDSNAEEAIEFYTSIFPDSSITNRSNYPEGSPGPAGQLMTATFKLHGQEFIALNGCVQFKFTEAISFTVDCESQEEVDYYWYKLLEGGEPSQCGWLKDKFGLSWQIVPRALGELMGDPNPEKSQRVMQAMLQMVKLDVQKLKAAYDGE